MISSNQKLLSTYNIRELPLIFKIGLALNRRVRIYQYLFLHWLACSSVRIAKTNKRIGTAFSSRSMGLMTKYFTIPIGKRIINSFLLVDLIEPSIYRTTNLSRRFLLTAFSYDSINGFLFFSASTAPSKRMTRAARMRGTAFSSRPIGLTTKYFIILMDNRIINGILLVFITNSPLGLLQSVFQKFGVCYHRPLKLLAKLALLPAISILNKAFTLIKLLFNIEIAGDAVLIKAAKNLITSNRYSIANAGNAQ